MRAHFWCLKSPLFMHVINKMHHASGRWIMGLLRTALLLLEAGEFHGIKLVPTDVLKRCNYGSGSEAVLTLQPGNTWLVCFKPIADPCCISIKQIYFWYSVFSRSSPWRDLSWLQGTQDSIIYLKILGGNYTVSIRWGVLTCPPISRCSNFLLLVGTPSRVKYRYTYLQSLENFLPCWRKSFRIGKSTNFIRDRRLG